MFKNAVTIVKIVVRRLFMAQMKAVEEENASMECLRQLGYKCAPQSQKWVPSPILGDQGNLKTLKIVQMVVH